MIVREVNRAEGYLTDFFYAYKKAMTKKLMLEYQFTIKAVNIEFFTQEDK